MTYAKKLYSALKNSLNSNFVVGKVYCLDLFHNVVIKEHSGVLTAIIYGHGGVFRCWRVNNKWSKLIQTNLTEQEVINN